MFSLLPLYWSENLTRWIHCRPPCFFCVRHWSTALGLWGLTKSHLQCDLWKQWISSSIISENFLVWCFLIFFSFLLSRSHQGYPVSLHWSVSETLSYHLIIICSSFSVVFLFTVIIRFSSCAYIFLNYEISLDLIYFQITCICTCMHAHLCMRVQCLKSPEEDIRSSRARVTGSCEQSDMRAGDWTQVFCKSSIYSYSLSHLSNPFDFLKMLSLFLCSAELYPIP